MRDVRSKAFLERRKFTPPRWADHLSLVRTFCTALQSDVICMFTALSGTIGLVNYVAGADAE